MLTPPPPPKKKKGKQQKREASKMEKIVRKYSQLSWHEALFLGPFWFFKVHILAWNRKQLEEGISCIFYWPEGPFLSYWQVFLTNHLWNKKKFPWEIPHLVIDDKGPYTWKDCSNSLLKRAARPPKRKSISEDIKIIWQGIVTVNYSCCSWEQIPQLMLSAETTCPIL